MHDWLLALVGVVLSVWCLRTLAFGKVPETILERWRRVLREKARVEGEVGERFQRAPQRAPLEVVQRVENQGQSEVGGQ